VGTVGPQAQRRQGLGLHARIQVGVRPDRAGDLADGDLLARPRQRLARAAQLGVEAGEDLPRGDRLGVDAVRAADHRRAPVLLGAAAARGAQPVDAGQDLVGGVAQQDRERRVEHVR